MKDGLDNTEGMPKAGASRLAGGVTAVVALALAVNALFGAVTAGVVQSDRYSEGAVARYVAVAIVRGLARVRDQDVPCVVGGQAVAARTRRGVECVDCSSQVAGGVGLDRLVAGMVDLPPPAKA